MGQTNDYLTGIEGMPLLLDCCGGDPMQYFSKKKYADSFQKISAEHRQTLEAIEREYITVIDRDQMLTNMSAALIDHAAEELAGCKKRRTEQKMLDLNLTMAVFVIPMVLEFHGESSRDLADKLVAGWKTQFPKSNITTADYETIEAGFHKKFCYITTAVCRCFDKPDDCYELTLLRDYRDGYLAESPGGEELIQEYYDVAPSIVKHIDQQPNALEIYQSIWDQWLSPCIEMIEASQLEDCRLHYTEMVRCMQEQYFHRRVSQTC